jgi:hypothetical protein
LAGVDAALLIAAALMLASPLIGLWLRMPRIGARGEETVVLDDPEVRLALTGRSGPVVVEIEYRVQQGKGRFTVSCRRCSCSASATALMAGQSRETSPIPNCGQSVVAVRPGSTICASATATERQALALHIGPGPVRVRRMLERPFGSVRSKDYTPDDAAGPDHNGVDRAGAAIGAPTGAPAVPAVASPNRT